MYERILTEDKSQPDGEDEERRARESESTISLKYENFGPTFPLREWMIRISVYNYFNRQWDLIQAFDADPLLSELSSYGP